MIINLHYPRSDRGNFLSQEGVSSDNNPVGYFLNKEIASNDSHLEDLIVFLHAQRTAGSNLRIQVLEKGMTEEKVYAHQYKDGFKRWKNVEFRDLIGYDAYVGHCDYVSKNMFRNLKLISLVRHPFFRFVSLYHYSQKEDKMLYEIAHGNSIEEFVHRLNSEYPKYFNNSICRRISGHPSFEWTKKIISEKYFAIGCTENMSAFAEMLTTELDLEKTMMSEIDPDYVKYSNYLENQDLINLVLENNREDEKLFHYLNDNYFGNPTENYPRSTKKPLELEYSLEAEALTNLIEITEFNKEVAKRLQIRNNDTKEMIIDIELTEPCFQFTWQEIDPFSTLSYRILINRDDSWQIDHGFMPLVPNPDEVLARCDETKREMITVIDCDLDELAATHRIILANESGIFSKLPLVWEKFLFNWEHIDHSCKPRFKIQKKTDGNWEDVQSYRRIDPPIGIIALSDSEPNMKPIDLCSITQEIIHQGRKRNVTISASSPPLPKGTMFAEHGYDRASKNSNNIVVGCLKNVMFISNDLGNNWTSRTINDVETIENTFITSKGTILICGKDTTDETLNRIGRVGLNDSYESTIVGKCHWHGTFSIDEQDGVIMYAEYPANLKDEDKHSPSIFRSKDDGQNWENLFTVDFPDIHHFHTCTALGGKKWIITSGDQPFQCRFWKSDNHGESWIEITEANLKVELSAKYLQSIHRTVVMHVQENELLWATDDILCERPEYQPGINGGSMLVSKSLENDSNLEVMCTLGMPIRSMIDIGEAYILISEAKFPELAKGPQVFLVFKNELNAAHYLMEIPNPYGGKNGGTTSRSSIRSKEEFFFSRLRGNSFQMEHPPLIRWHVKIE
jgi:hypothetical protein